MGSPRQTFAGDTRLNRAGESVGSRGRDGVPPIWRYTPTFWNTLSPASPKMEEEKEEDTEKLRIVFLLRRTQKYLFHQKVPAPPPQRLPLGRRSVGGCLSRWTLQETETFEEEGEEDLKPCFPFWRAESTSQLVFKLSLVKTISLLSPCPNSPRKREKAISNKYEKLVVSRSEDSSLFCTKIPELQGFS